MNTNDFTDDPSWAWVIMRGIGALGHGWNRWPPYGPFLNLDAPSPSCLKTRGNFTIRGYKNT